MTPIQQYIQYAKHVKGYNDNTIRAYESDIHNFCIWLSGSKPGARWSTLTRDDIDNYITYRSQQGMKASTTNREIAAISSIYCFFQRIGVIKENPTKLENRKKLPETIPNTIPMNDLRKAYSHSQGCVKTMLGILATTGIRLQEMLDLTWQDIDFENSSLKIMGKGQRERIVYTSPDILAQLKESRKYVMHNRKLFWIGQRTARKMIYDALRPYTRARQLSPHAIRHTYATELAKNGVTATSIAKTLGHKRLDTTQKYINMAEIEAANNSFANLINISA